MWEQRLKTYDELIGMSKRFARKGKTVPYTSANGYMFSQLNKDGEIGIGIRLPKETQKAFKEQYNATEFKSYGSIMRDYVKVPDKLLKDLDLVHKYLEKGYDFVLTLPKK